MSFRPNRRFLRSNGNGIAMLIGLALIAAWIILPNDGSRAGTSALFRSASLRHGAGPRLVSIQPLPAIEGAACEWMPASAPASAATGLTAALRQAPAADRAAQASPNGARNAVDIERAPLRIIRDTYPTYSAIAVDTVSNEVYMQDENLFGFKVFNRLDNTPPNAPIYRAKAYRLRTEYEA